MFVVNCQLNPISFIFVLFFDADKSASENICQTGNSSSRREKSSSNKHATPSQTSSGYSGATPPNSSTTGSASRDSLAKETKSAASSNLGSTKSTVNSNGTQSMQGNTTPVADSQFTDLFGPPIQTRPTSNESANGNPASTNSSAGGSGNTSASNKSNKSVSVPLFDFFAFYPYFTTHTGLYVSLGANTVMMKGAHHSRHWLMSARDTGPMRVGAPLKY